MSIRQIGESERIIALGYETAGVIQARRAEVDALGIKFELAVDSDGNPFIEAGSIELAWIETSSGDRHCSSITSSIRPNTTLSSFGTPLPVAVRPSR